MGTYACYATFRLKNCIKVSALCYSGYKSYSFERSKPREDVCTLILALVCYSVEISLRHHKPDSSVIGFDCMRYASSPTEKVEDPCILDLGFVLDASSSITNAWRDVRVFVTGVTKLPNVSTEGTHVGVIKFGTDSKIEFGFNDGQDTDTVVDKVLRLRMRNSIMKRRIRTATGKTQRVPPGVFLNF